MHFILCVTIILITIVEIHQCYFPMNAASKRKIVKRDTDISSTRKRCLEEAELERRQNHSYVLHDRYREHMLGYYRSQCRGTPEEATLHFCWSLEMPEPCGFEPDAWVAVGDDLLTRCRNGLYGGPFPVMTADDLRRYSNKSSGVFIRCTDRGAIILLRLELVDVPIYVSIALLYTASPPFADQIALNVVGNQCMDLVLVGRQWCGRHFLIREVSNRELDNWYEIGSAWKPTSDIICATASKGEVEARAI